MVYLAVFAVVLFLMNYSSKFVGYTKQIIISLCVLILALVFGLRDLSVGTDTLLYVDDVWLYACVSSKITNLIGNLSFHYAHNIEFLYIVWNYIISRISHNINFYLFMTGLLLYGLFFNSFGNHEKKYNALLATCIFLCIFFREGFNTLRQNMALAFCIVSFSNLLDNKYLKACLFSLIAYGFHHSAAIFFVVIIGKKLIDNNVNLVQRNVVKILLIVILTIVFVFLSTFLNFFESLNVIDSRYVERYGDDSEYGSNLPYSVLFISIVNLFVFYNIKKEVNPKTLLYEYILIIAFALCFTGLISRNLARISGYFQICSLLIFPYLYKHFHVPQNIKIIHITSLALYWVMVVIILNLGATYPYKSSILGI